MARTKKSIEKEESIIEEIIHEEKKPEKESILKLAIDFSNEGLNNIARKINEIIDHLNR